VGTGSLTLTGSDSYTGRTIVGAGKVVLGTNAQTPVLTLGGADIRAGELILDYSDGGPDPVAGVRSLLTTGFNQNPKFSTSQIRTSNTPDARKGIGYIDATGASQVSIAYTYYGDADLDGAVNTADFTALAAHFNNTALANSGTPAWYEGDFNYDGKVNALDFNMLAANFGQSNPASPLGLGTVLPEPAGLMMLFVVSGSITRRRRRTGS
jgi:autotransporter-associated beta strand protein